MKIKLLDEISGARNFRIMKCIRATSIRDRIRAAFFISNREFNSRLDCQKHLILQLIKVDYVSEVEESASLHLGRPVHGAVSRAGRRKK